MQEQGLSPQERLKQIEVNPDDLDQLIDQGWETIAQNVEATNKESLQDIALSREWVTESDDPDLHAALTGEANSALAEINKAKDVATAEIQKTLALPAAETSVAAQPETGLALAPETAAASPAESPQAASTTPEKEAPAASKPAAEQAEAEISPEKAKLSEVMLSLVALVKEFQQANFQASDEMRSRLNKLMAKAHPDRNPGLAGMDRLSMMAGRLKNIFAGIDKLQTSRGVSYVDDLKSLQVALELPELDLEVVVMPRPAPTVVEEPAARPAPTVVDEEPAAESAPTEEPIPASMALGVGAAEPGVAEEIPAEETPTTETAVQPEAGQENREKEIGEIYQGIGEVARELRKQEGYTTDEMLAQFKDVSDKALDVERTSSGTEAYKKMGTAREHLFKIIYGLSDPGERLKALDAFFQENPDLEGEAEEESEVVVERSAASLPRRPEMPEFDDFDGMMQVESWAFAVSPEQFHDFFIKKDGERHELALKDMEDIMLTRQTLIENLSKVAPINKAVGNKIRLQIEMLQSANEITEKRRAQWEKQKELHLGEQKMTEVSAEVDALHAERVEMEGDERRTKDLAGKLNEFDHKSTELQQMILYVEGLRKQVGDMDADINSQLKRLQDSKTLLAQLEGQAKAAQAQGATEDEERKKGIELGMVGDWSPHEGAQAAFEGAGEAVGGAIEKTTDKFLDLTHDPTAVAAELVDKVWSIGDSKPSAKKASKPKKAA